MEDLTVKEKKPAIKKGWLRVIVTVISFFIVSTILQTIVMIIIVTNKGIKLTEINDFISSADNFSFTMLLRVLGLFALFFVIWIFRKFVDRRSFISLGFHVKNRAKDMLMGFLYGILLISFGFFALYLFGFLEVKETNLSSSAIFNGLFFFAMVAVHEELLLRGYVLNNLMKSFNKYIALAITSVVFACIHIPNPNITIIAFVNLVLAGLVLGISYIHTKNLWFPIFLHFSWNFFLGPIFGFEVSGLTIDTIVTQEVTGSELITGGDFGFEGSLILSALLVGSFFILNYYFKKREAT